MWTVLCKGSLQNAVHHLRFVPPFSLHRFCVALFSDSSCALLSKSCYCHSRWSFLRIDEKSEGIPVTMLYTCLIGVLIRHFPVDFYVWERIHMRIGLYYTWYFRGCWKNHKMWIIQILKSYALCILDNNMHKTKSMFPKAYAAHHDQTLMWNISRGQRLTLVAFSVTLYLIFKIRSPTGPGPYWFR